uniref:Uncharacterized protein n=1 Tax=Oryza barthii TaxID=65489 RepID=A0A0D3FLF9_9ORYZ
MSSDDEECFYDYEEEEEEEEEEPGWDDGGGGDAMLVEEEAALPERPVDCWVSKAIPTPLQKSLFRLHSLQLVLQQLVLVTNYIVFLDMLDLPALYVCTQQQDLSMVMNLLYIKQHQARALLIHHHRWKMESILDHFDRKGRDRMLREAGVVIQQ